MMHTYLPSLRKLVVAVLAVGLLVTSPALAAPTKDENLVYSANFEDAAKVRTWLNQGANPDATGEEGWPAISLAATRTDEEGMKIVRMLVDAGANVNVRDPNDETPLMNAIVSNNSAMVKYLIEHGADFRAMSKSGRTVQQFAEHYSDENVVFYIKEAIRLEEERIREGRSRKQLYKMLDDYVYYNCALQYLSYNQAVGIYPQSKQEEIARKTGKVQGRIGNAQAELQYNFRMSQSSLKDIASRTQTMMFNELEGLISNRNRLKLGVGTDKDLDKRCQKVLSMWQDSFARYEQQTANQR